MMATLIAIASSTSSSYDDVIRWKHLPRFRPFVRVIHRSHVNSPQMMRNFDIFLICAWINGWVNNREDGELRRHHNVTVMKNLHELFFEFCSFDDLLIDGCHITFKNVKFITCSYIQLFLSNRSRVQDLTYDLPTLVRVMAWCRQAISHNLDQCNSISTSLITSIDHNELMVIKQLRAPHDDVAT